MNYIKKLLKPFIYIFITLILSLLLLTTLNYFDVINQNTSTIIKILIPIISFFIGSFILGKNSNKKGWLEGLKLSSILILLFILLNYIIFKQSFQLKSIIFYITLIISSILGSIIGINKKNKE